MATCGVSAGAAKVFEVFRALAESNAGKAKLGATGCLGMCYREPLVEVDDGSGKYIYGEVDGKKAKQIFQGHVLGGEPVEQYLVLRNFTEGREYDYLARQVKIVLRNCGYLDPDSIEDYERRDGYKAIRKVLAEMTPEEVIQVIADSGLRGRGGAGFPTGQKWKFGRQAPGDVKYVVCNADEGDPGAFMDRSVLEGDPHTVLEGMMIAAYAIGASPRLHLLPSRVPAGSQEAQARHRAPSGEGLPGEECLRLRHVLRREAQGRGRRLRVRRGDGPHRLDRREARDAAAAAPVPRREGAVGQAHQYQQRRDLRQRAVDHPERRGQVCRLGDREEHGTKVFAVAGRAKRNRPRGGPHGDHHRRRS